MDDVYCPVCGGDPVPLGHLGNLLWCRCRNCGVDFNVTPDPEPVAVGDDDDADE